MFLWVYIFFMVEIVRKCGDSVSISRIIKFLGEIIFSEMGVIFVFCLNKGGYVI